MGVEWGKGYRHLGDHSNPGKRSQGAWVTETLTEWGQYLGWPEAWQPSGGTGTLCQTLDVCGHPCLVQPGPWACYPNLADSPPSLGHPIGTRTSTEKPQTFSTMPCRSGSRHWALSTLQ